MESEIVGLTHLLPSIEHWWFFQPDEQMNGFFWLEI
jgi:hypothetical protein